MIVSRRLGYKTVESRGKEQNIRKRPGAAEAVEQLMVMQNASGLIGSISYS